MLTEKQLEEVLYLQNQIHQAKKFIEAVEENEIRKTQNKHMQYLYFDIQMRGTIGSVDLRFAYDSDVINPQDVEDFVYALYIKAKQNLPILKTRLAAYIK